MKKPHLLETSFLWNMQCVLESLSDMAVTGEVGTALQDLSKEFQKEDPLRNLEPHYQLLRRFSWTYRNDPKRPVVDACLMLVEALRCVASSKASLHRRGAETEAEVEVENDE